MIKLYINKELYNDIVLLFNCTENNDSEIIGKKLNLPKHIVSNVLDCYLSKKRNYMGRVNEYEICYEKRTTADKYTTFINGREFDLISKASNFYRISKKDFLDLIPDGECSTYIKLGKKQNLYHIVRKLK